MAASAIHDHVGRRVWTEKVMTSEWARSQSPMIERLKMAFGVSVQAPSGTGRILTEAELINERIDRELSKVVKRALLAPFRRTVTHRDQTPNHAESATDQRVS
jgi:hypothetical protein